MSRLFFVPLALCLLLLGSNSCRNENLMSHAGIKFKDHIWDHKDSVKFNFNIPDTSELYSLNLDVTHGKNYKYQNLYLKLITKFPSGKSVSDITSLQLIDNYGYSQGECSSNTCTVEFTLASPVKFDMPGRYALQLLQWNRDTAIADLHSLVFTLLKYPEEKE